MSLILYRIYNDEIKHKNTPKIKFWGEEEEKEKRRKVSPHTTQIYIKPI